MNDYKNTIGTEFSLISSHQKKPPQTNTNNQTKRIKIINTNFPESKLLHMLNYPS